MNFSCNPMKRLSFLVTMFFFFACETVVEVDIPRNPSQLTVNSLFNPDSAWQVELSQDRFILDSKQFAPVPDAEVRITQDGQAVAMLEYNGDAPFTRNSIYRANRNFPAPQAGESYTLEVAHPTFTNLSAVGQAPINESTLISAVLDTLDTRVEPGSPDRIAYALIIQFKDHPTASFYSVSAELRFKAFGLTTLNDSTVGTVRNIRSLSSVFTIDPVVDNPFDNYRDELLFKDVSFNGKTYELKLYVAFEDNSAYTNLFTSPLLLQDETLFDEQGNVAFVPGDTIDLSSMHVLLRTVSNAYYEYGFTRDLQASVEDNPFAQPVQVFDNIEGGLGIFTGYSQQEQKVTIRQGE